MAVPTTAPTLQYVDLDGEHTFAIQGDSISIGRSPDQDLVLKEAFVSRRHALISRRNGAFELVDQNSSHGTYLNGFYEESPIVYPEGAFGFARNHHVQLNIADGKRIRLEVDGEPLDLSTGEVEYQERSLDLRAGILHRRLRWRSPGGRRTPAGR